MINDLKLRVRPKHEKVFLKNLEEKGWEAIREGYYSKGFGTDTKAEIHQKVLPFSGQSYFSLYVTDPDTLTKHIIYEIVNEMEDMEKPKR